MLVALDSPRLDVVRLYAQRRADLYQRQSIVIHPHRHGRAGHPRLCRAAAGRRKVVDRGDIATKSRSPGPGRGHRAQRPEMGILLGDGASSHAGETPLKTRFSIMLIAGLVACTGLPVQAAEPTVAGLWEKKDDQTGKSVGWFVFVERNGVFEGAFA